MSRLWTSIKWKVKCVSSWYCLLRNVIYIFISEEWKVVKIQPMDCIVTLFINHPCCSHISWSFFTGILFSLKIRSCKLDYPIITIHMHEYLRGPTNILFSTLYILYILFLWDKSWRECNRKLQVLHIRSDAVVYSPGILRLVTWWFVFYFLGQHCGPIIRIRKFNEETQNKITTLPRNVGTNQPVTRRNIREERKTWQKFKRVG
jgi:hypothetical protein